MARAVWFGMCEKNEITLLDLVVGSPFHLSPHPGRGPQGSGSGIQRSTLAYSFQLSIPTILFHYSIHLSTRTFNFNSFRRPDSALRLLPITPTFDLYLFYSIPTFTPIFHFLAQLSDFSLNSSTFDPNSRLLPRFGILYPVILDFGYSDRVFDPKPRHFTPTLRTPRFLDPPPPPEYPPPGVRGPQVS